MQFKQALFLNLQDETSKLSNLLLSKQSEINRLYASNIKNLEEVVRVQQELTKAKEEIVRLNFFCKDREKLACERREMLVELRLIKLKLKKAEMIGQFYAKGETRSVSTLTDFIVERNIKQEQEQEQEQQEYENNNGEWF